MATQKRKGERVGDVEVVVCRSGQRQVELGDGTGSRSMKQLASTVGMNETDGGGGGFRQHLKGAAIDSHGFKRGSQMTSKGIGSAGAEQSDGAAETGEGKRGSAAIAADSGRGGIYPKGSLPIKAGNGSNESVPNKVADDQDAHKPATLEAATEERFKEVSTDLPSTLDDLTFERKGTASQNTTQVRGVWFLLNVFEIFSEDLGDALQLAF